MNISINNREVDVEHSNKRKKEVNNDLVYNELIDTVYRRDD